MEEAEEKGSRGAWESCGRNPYSFATGLRGAINNFSFAISLHPFTPAPLHFCEAKIISTLRGEDFAADFFQDFCGGSCSNAH
jgi:hypothetical protein